MAAHRGAPQGAARPLLAAGTKRPAPYGGAADYGQPDGYGRQAAAYAGAPSAYPDIYGQQPRGAASAAAGAGGPPDVKKSKPLLDWDVKPIAQQPLRGAGMGYGGAPASREPAWYQDSY